MSLVTQLTSAFAAVATAINGKMTLPGAGAVGTVLTKTTDGNNNQHFAWSALPIRPSGSFSGAGAPTSPASYISLDQYTDTTTGNLYTLNADIVNGNSWVLAMTNVLGDASILKIVKITQVAYTALATPSPTTLYVIVG